MDGKAANWKATGKQRDENKTGALGHASEKPKHTQTRGKLAATEKDGKGGSRNSKVK